MVSILTILRRKRWPLVAAVTLLLAPFMVATSYARDVPFNISYTGSLVPIPVNVYPDEFDASMVDAQSHGTFGASMTQIVTEWTPIGFCSVDDTIIKFTLVQAAIVVTFANGDQLFGAGNQGGEMCLNRLTGYFEGVASGGFADGTGRFEGASGTFSSPFSGHNMTAFTLGFGFGPIRGTLEGTLSF